MYVHVSSILKFVMCDFGLNDVLQNMHFVHGNGRGLTKSNAHSILP